MGLKKQLYFRTMRIIKLLFVLLWTSNVTFAQDGDCHQMKFYIDSIVKSVSQQDKTAFVNLASLEAMMSITQEKMSKYMLDALTKQPEIFEKMFEVSYQKLVDNIDREFGTGKWELNFLEYKIRKTQDDGIVLHNTVEIWVIIANIKMAFTIYLTKYNDCYYIIEPSEGFIYDSLDK